MLHRIIDWWNSMHNVYVNGLLQRPGTDNDYVWHDDAPCFEYFLKKGDIIAIERPIFRTIFHDVTEDVSAYDRYDHGDVHLFLEEKK